MTVPRAKVIAVDAICDMQDQFLCQRVVGDYCTSDEEFVCLTCNGRPPLSRRRTLCWINCWILYFRMLGQRLTPYYPLEPFISLPAPTKFYLAPS